LQHLLQMNIFLLHNLYTHLDQLVNLDHHTFLLRNL
jgi:hypothetical protein